eukprot:gene1964-2988_t
MPDNIVVMQGFNELLIAEDTSRHEFNYLWSYNLGSKQLTRIAAVPLGAEVTGTAGYHFQDVQQCDYFMLSNQAECVLSPTKYEYVTIKGVGISNPCSGSVTPWGTHLGSEEGDPDAAKYEAGMDEGDMSGFAVELDDGEEEVSDSSEFMRFFGMRVNTVQDALAITIDEWKQFHPYQYGHAWEFKVLDAAGNYEIKKQYALGRASFEMCLVSPDHMTTYCTDDGTNSGFYRFDATRPGDFEAGELSCARATQTSSANGGAFDIDWISLGYTTNATDDEETKRLAAFFETRRFCGMQGGTVEFTKMEGITYDNDGGAYYTSISDVKTSMTEAHEYDAVTGDHILVQGYNELLIAEDTSRHEYDYLWSYNLGSKELTRIAAVPLGAEVTGTSGYHFQDVQHCDYFMLTNQEPDMGHAAVVLLSSKSRVLRAPAVGGSKGTLTFSQLMDKTTPDFKISHSEYVNKNGELMPLKMNMLGKSGDQIADGPPFGTLYTVDGEKIVDKD